MVYELIGAVVFGVGDALRGGVRYLLRGRRVRAARRVLESTQPTDPEIERVLIGLLGYEDPEAKELRSRLASLRTRV